MRYGNPSIDKALKQFKDKGISKIIVLPLYPQAGSPTTSSTMDAVNKFLSEQSWTPNLRFISGYHDNDNYIDSISKSIEDSFSKKDNRLWVPLSPGRWSRPLCYNISQGYWVHLTKVIGGGFLSRHRHPAPVHGFVIKGSWRYLEHDWVAKEGSYLFEPPGEIHTLVVDEDCEEMITLFHNSGALIYCDKDGNTVGSTDVC